MSVGQVVQIGFTVVGAYFGGPYGATAGSLIGGYFGRSIDAKDYTQDLQGPRLSDNKVQLASYGVPRPRVYGALALAGNVIWTSDLIETAHTSSSTQEAGKGGGGDSQTTNVTTYTYSVNCAIGVCDGPIAGICRIWANGRLIFNAADSVDAATALASQSFADSIRIYLGDESQIADPLIEAAEGAGNVPGYRGLAYVVLEDFQLAEFGNRMPLFEFEAIASGSEELPGILATIPSTAGVQTLEYSEGTYTTGTISTGAGTDLAVSTYDSEGNVLLAQSTSRRAVSGSALIPKGNWRGLVLENYGSYAANWWNVETDESSSAGWLADAAVTPLHVCRGQYYAFILYRVAATNAMRVAKLPLTPYLEASGGGGHLGGTSVPHSYPEKVLDLWINASGRDFIFFDGTWVWVADTQNGVLYRYTQDLVLSAQWSYTLPGGGVHGYIYVFGDRFAIAPGSGNVGARIFKLNADSTTTALVSTSWDSGEVVLPYPPSPGVLIGLTTMVSVNPRLAVDAATLSDVVTAECALAGLDASDLDVTELTDDVRGYAVRRAPLGANLAPLMAAFSFDPVESDGKLKFVKRGGAAAVTIPAADLAARAAGDKPPAPIEHSHTQEQALPAEVMVTFLNANAHYEPGAQYARRQARNARGQETLELPIVLTDAEALNICHVLLFERWAAREGFAFQTSRKYARYEPGDVVTLPFPTGDTSEVRITKRDEGANGVVRWEGQFTDASVYTQDATAAVPPDQAEGITLPGPTLFRPLDIPLLRDVDDTYGYYGAALGYLDGWRGAQVYVSRDGGTSYDAPGEGLFLVEATQGHAETALATCALVDQFDEAGTVDVKLVEGTLSSVTRDQVLDGANFALLGDEIFQFKTATQLAAKRYRLTSLLRGRLGTDRAVGGHAVNERFVLLERSALRFIPADPVDVGVERTLKAVTFGNRLAGATPRVLTYEGNNLKPLSPVHFHGGRDAAGNLNMAWVRRTRLNAVWRDYVDAPLGEASESYEIDVLNGSTVVRTLSATTNSKQYTAAQQTTDFGSPQASITLNLYQVSARVGRGFARSATL